MEIESAPGATPTLRVRAPGRVNLIGDHTDYNGLPVLPMAIQRAVSVEFSVRDDPQVYVTADDASDPPASFRLDRPRRPHPPGDWRNYLHAASLVLDECVDASPDTLVGIDAHVTGDIPLAAGLSSSSALVVAMALAFVRANRIEVDPLVLSDHCARAERYVGTQGGGMDQTASIMGKEGCALRIDFDPIRVRPLSVPNEWSFVVAHSGERAEKSGGAQALYNQRVEACRRALTSVRAALAASRGAEAAALAADYPTLVPHVDRELWDWALDLLQGLERDCFRHTVSEAQRVIEAERMLEQGDAHAFGRLMSASHESLASHYRVSTPRLDALVGAAFEAGALGARLTGAGLGGCVVALALPPHVERVEAALREQVVEWVPEPVVFRARPSAGATVGPAEGVQA